MNAIIPALTLTSIASGAVTARRWVSYGGALASPTSLLRGVARTDAADDEAFPVDVLGVVSVETGAAVAQFARVGADSLGRAVAVTPGRIRTAIVNGGAPGNITVNGIAATDELLAVISMTEDGAGGVTLGVIDTVLTNEFTITAANTINNTGGTNTTSKRLLVMYRQFRPIGGIALTAAGAAGQTIQVQLIPQAVA